MATTLIVGDLHIGKGQSIGKSYSGFALNSRVQDQLTILEWILREAIDHNATSIILTGDIFEEVKPQVQFIALFIEWLRRCTEHGIKIHIVVGNHDVLRSGQLYTSVLDLIIAAGIENVFIYNDISTVHLDKVSFTLMPFRDRKSLNTDSNAAAIQILQKKLPYERASINKNNLSVVVGHLALEGALYVGDEYDDSANELFCPLDMFKDYHMVFMGHIHRPQVMSKNKHSNYLCHIGSVDISDFGETNHKKVIAVFNPDNAVPFKYIDIPTRPLKEIDISVPTKVLDATSFVEKELDKQGSLAKAIVRLNIMLENSDATNCDRTVIENKIKSLGAFHIARISEERKIEPIKRNTVFEEIDSTVDEFKAIDMYSVANIEEALRNDFKDLAKSIVTEYISEKG